MPLEARSMDDDTDIIAVGDVSSPVFVDASGRRGKRIRVAFGVLGAATLVYGALVATSLAGGPLKPQQLLPFPDLVNNLPVLDPQPPVPQPGAKNTPVANRPLNSTAKKIVKGQPVPSASLPPGAAGVLGTPEAIATTAPSADATSAAPEPQPSADPTRTPRPSVQPSASVSPTTPQTGQTEGTSGTPSRSAGTVPVGETATARPGASRMAGGANGTDAETGGSGPVPSRTVSVGQA
ncbi:hypothetical protein ABT297_13245 [Dactylosporangium sp. NPDC000555]|uniref:hypothetical protein n=1 Tax=Dactylosporangium sp. NPDC000555 TaxID=3154260 RepID=UPI003318714C